MGDGQSAAPTRTSNGFNQDQGVKHVQYLPVVGALAETILPALPDKAADAEKQGLHDFAQLQAFGGSSQTAQVEKVGLVTADITQLHFLCPNFVWSSVNAVATEHESDSMVCRFSTA